MTVLGVGHPSHSALIKDHAFDQTIGYQVILGSDHKVSKTDEIWNDKRF